MVTYEGITLFVPLENIAGIYYSNFMLMGGYLICLWLLSLLRSLDSFWIPMENPTCFIRAAKPVVVFNPSLHGGCLLPPLSLFCFLLGPEEIKPRLK